MITSHPIKNDFDMGPSNINYIKAARGGGILCFTLKSFHAREKMFQFDDYFVKNELHHWKELTKLRRMTPL